MKIAAVGDVCITRQMTSEDIIRSSEICNLFKNTDVRFANFEMVVAEENENCYPSPFPGGGWIRSNPELLKDLQHFDFNIVSTANNHSMDYCHNGVIETIKNLCANNIVYAGSGIDLKGASSPAYINTQNGHCALVAVTSSFNEFGLAAYKRKNVPGRPGINPLRHDALYSLSDEDFFKLSEIAEKTGVNDYHNHGRKYGYLPQIENLIFGRLKFQKGGNIKVKTTPNKKDLARTLQQVKEAKAASDCVIVSVHSHQFSENNDEIPSEFIQIFCRECVDAGAKVIIGHGAHLIRGVEVYHGGIIFYGLGDFIFENETVESLPYEFYEKYNVDIDASVEDAFNVRSKNGKMGLTTDKRAWESVLAIIDINKDQLFSVKLYPVALGFELSREKKGIPMLQKNDTILLKMKELSMRYSTDITIENHIGLVKV